MIRKCFSFSIYPGKEVEYQVRHDEIWPEMLAALTRAGYRNYTLFLSKLTIVGYYELEEVELTQTEKAEVEAVQARWSVSMREIIDFSTVVGSAALIFREVWHLA